MASHPRERASIFREETMRDAKDDSNVELSMCRSVAELRPRWTTDRRQHGVSRMDVDRGSTTGQLVYEPSRSPCSSLSPWL